MYNPSHDVRALNGLHTSPLERVNETPWDAVYLVMSDKGSGASYLPCEVSPTVTLNSVWANLETWKGSLRRVNSMSVTYRWVSNGTLTDTVAFAGTSFGGDAICFVGNHLNNSRVTIRWGCPYLCLSSICELILSCMPNSELCETRPYVIP